MEKLQVRLDKAYAEKDKLEAKLEYSQSELGKLQSQLDKTSSDQNFKYNDYNDGRQKITKLELEIERLRQENDRWLVSAICDIKRVFSSPSLSIPFLYSFIFKGKPYSNALLSFVG